MWRHLMLRRPRHERLRTENPSDLPFSALQTDPQATANCLWLEATAVKYRNKKLEALGLLKLWNRGRPFTLECAAVGREEQLASLRIDSWVLQAEICLARSRKVFP